jgi:putative transcriptional regulator
MQSLSGFFLVASPHLADTNFYRSVVLMIQHNEQGAFGVVLNRPSTNTVADLWKLIAQDACDNREPVYVGGPVAGPLVAIHGDAARSELEITPGVFFASQKDTIVEIVTRPEGPFRLFVGYAGWGGGQLEGELEAGGWLSEKATAADVFSDAADLWNRVARRIGLEILMPAIKRPIVPDDPSMN